MATIGSLEFETVIKTDSLKKSEDEIKKAVSEITKAITQQSADIADSNKTISDSATSATSATNKAMDAVGKTAEKIVQENEKVAETVNQNITDIAQTAASSADKVTTAIQDETNAISNVNQAMNEKPDGLTSALDSLISKLEQTPSAVSDVSKGLEELSTENTKKIGELSEDLKQLNADLKSLNESGKGGGTGAKNIQDRIKLIRDEITERKDLQKNIVDNQKALKDNEFANVKKSVDEYTDSLLSAVGGNSKFGQSMVKLAQSGKGVNSLFDGLKIGIKSFGQTLTGLMANPAFLAIAGVAGVAAGFKWWYDYNSGLVQATALTADFTGKSGDDLKNFRNEIQALADTYGRDFQDVLSATDTLVSHWGVSFDEAFDVIEKGFIGGVDITGNFLETLGKYPAQFKELGVSAEEYIAIIQQTNSGIFGEKGMAAMSTAMDKIRNMSKATESALKNIGINAKDIQSGLADGSLSMLDVIQDVSTHLKDFGNDSQEVEKVLKNVFGGAGLQSGQEMIEMFDELGMSLDDLVDKQGEFGTAQKRLLDSEKEFNNKMSELFDTTGGFFETLTTNVKALWNEFLISILDWFVDIKNYLIDVWDDSEGLRKTVGVLAKLAVNLFKVSKDGLKAIGKSAWDFIQIINPVNWSNPEKLKSALNDMLGVWDDYNKQVKKTVTDLFTLSGAEDFNKKIRELKNDQQTDAGEEKKEKKDKPDEPEPIKIEDLLAKRKKAYEDYAAAIASTDKEISANAVRNGKTLMAQGATWEEYLQNIRKKYKGNADAIKKINNELLALQKQSLMDLWRDQLGDNVSLGKNLSEQLAAYQAARNKIADDDPLKNQKNEWIDDQIRDLVKSASADYIEAQKSQRDFIESSKKEWMLYADELGRINDQIKKTTNADELKILNAQKNATQIRMDMAINKDRIDQAKQLTDKLIAIELDRQKQIDDINSDESKSAALKDELIQRANENAANDVKIARNAFADVDGEFVETMLNDMQSVMGKQMDYYVQEIQKLQTMLDGMNPNTVDYMQLNAQLQALTQSYETLKSKSMSSTNKMAHDKSMQILKDSLNDFGDELQNIGGEIGGVAGDVISATGQMFNGVVSLTTSITKFAEINTQTIEGVSAAGVKAIKAVETASVILAIIGTIMQLIDAVRNIGANKDDADDLMNSVHALRDALKDVKDSADIADLRNSNTSLFGDDAWGMLVTNIDIAERALKNYTDAQNEMLKVGDANNKLNAILGREARYNTLDDIVGGMKIETQAAKKGFMGIGAKSAKHETLKNIAPDLFDSNGNLSMPALSEFKNSDLFAKLSGENQNLINNLVKQWDDYNDAISQVKDNFKSMFDGVGSEIMDSMVEMFQGGEDAIDHFNETWDNMIENMIKSMLFSKMIQPQIEQLTDNLEKVGFFQDPTKNLKSAIGVLGDAKKNIYNAKDGIFAALQSFSDIGNDNGLNLFAKNIEDSADNADETKKTLSGAIKGASQESIDLLAGQTNAVRVNQVESISIMRQQLAANIEINLSIVKNGAILNNILDELRSSGNMRAKGLDI